MSEAQRLTQALGGKWQGHYGLAFCPAHMNRRSPALSLSHGDDGRLLAHCHAGCDFGSVLDAMRGLGLISGRHVTPLPDPHKWAKQAEAKRQQAARRSAQAAAIWAETVPIGGTIAETYLREVRGITCPLSPNLRFCKVCWHGGSAQRLPAMIARVEGTEGFAIHRTYLRTDGSGKADVEPVKAMLGNTIGGAVRLSYGGEALAVAEGIESALSLLCGPLSGPVSVWAGLSASGLGALHLPYQASRLIIASDGDGAGHNAAQKLAARASALDWTVTLFPAPEGLDWNEVFRSGKKAKK